MLPTAHCRYHKYCAYTVLYVLLICCLLIGGVLTCPRKADDLAELGILDDDGDLDALGDTHPQLLADSNGNINRLSRNICIYITIYIYIRRESGIYMQL